MERILEAQDLARTQVISIFLLLLPPLLLPELLPLFLLISYFLTLHQSPYLPRLLSVSARVDAYVRKAYEYQRITAPEGLKLPGS